MEMRGVISWHLGTYIYFSDCKLHQSYKSFVLHDWDISSSMCFRSAKPGHLIKNAESLYISKYIDKLPIN